MKPCWSLVLLTACWALAGAAPAAQAPPEATVSPEAVEGRRLFQQKCALCHVAAVRDRDPYGPRLSRQQVARSEEGVKQIIRSGIGRMPGFQHALQPSQVDMIVAFMKTLAAPPDRVLTTIPNP